jgi:alpha-beta hydrolase superfamily lysophospholipase
MSIGGGGKMENGFFSGTNGSLRYYRGWRTEQKKRGSIVIVHGYAEHGDRYTELAKILNERGYDAWAEDHYGHGKSEGARSDVPSFELFVEDLQRFILDHVRPHLEGKPLFLYGHSMGGAISLLYTLTHQQDLAGLILSGPVVDPGAQAGSFERTAARIMSRILPSLPFRPFDPQLLSRDPEVCKAYTEDPLVYTGKMKIRMGNELLRAGELIRRRGLESLHIPLLIMHGEEDHVVDLSNSRLLDRKVSSTDKTFKIFKGMFHEIHNEPGKAEVYETVLSWLESRT